MILDILRYPNKCLDTPTEEVFEINEALLNKINNVIDTMYENNGCGLAANQVGFTESILVFDCSEEEDQPNCMINPVIVSTAGNEVNQEGCLSFPDIGVHVARPMQITVEYLDINGATAKKVFSGPEAVCIHHEVDHLLGKTFLSRVNRNTRRIAMKKLRKLK